MGGVMNRLKRVWPWNRPTVMDLPAERYIRVRALMLGAGLPRSADEHGKVHIEIGRLEHGE